MDSYQVLTPCAYVNAAGAAVVHRRPGAVVELDEATAAELGDAVRLVGDGGKSKRRIAREPKTQVEVGDGKAHETPLPPPEGPPVEETTNGQ